MTRKYKLQDLVNWGHIYDYEADELIKLGFIDVYYEDHMSTIKNINKDCNFQFYTDKSRRGYLSYTLSQIKPYKEIYPNRNHYCRSLWQCIKEYKKIAFENEEVF